MRIAIVGSRNFKHYSKVAAYFRDHIQPDDIIVSGGAIGIDKTAENIAKAAHMKTEIYLADWKRYGKSAGAIRNQIIVNMADKVVAFWDGKSPGTKITIDMAREANKSIEIVQDME